jgi:glutamate carboxypeptidase
MSNRVERILSFFEERRERFVETLLRFVSMETPSGDRERIDQFADFYAGLLRNHCERVSIIAGNAGARVRAESGSGGKTILLLGHLDTVWPLESENRPSLRRQGDILSGPGAFDMKAGLAMALFAFQAFTEMDLGLDKKLVLLATPDEESGSLSSRGAIEREAKEAGAVLVLEPPLNDGRMKTRRKGVGEFRIEVKGRESHAGINPEDGVNAIHELAHQIVYITGLNDTKRGITVNAGRIGGGIKDNVIPGGAWATIDFRALTIEDCKALAERIRNLKPVLAGAELMITGDVNRPPLVETEKSREIASQTKQIAAELGVGLKEGLSGGGSDGSFTAALGIPTIDGLGLDGRGAHSLDEQVDLSRIPFRCALLTELILRI